MQTMYTTSKPSRLRSCLMWAPSVLLLLLALLIGMSQLAHAQTAHPDSARAVAVGLTPSVLGNSWAPVAVQLLTTVGALWTPTRKLQLAFKTFRRDVYTRLDAIEGAIGSQALGIAVPHSPVTREVIASGPPASSFPH